MSDIKSALVLISGFLGFNLLAQIVLDLGYPNFASVVSYTWLLLVMYTWIGIPYYHRVLKQELEKFSFNRDY